MTNDNYNDYADDDDERTVFIPKPGNRKSTPPPIPPAAAQFPAPSHASTPPPQYTQNAAYSSTPESLTPSGVNPLVSAASGLIALPSQLIKLASHHDISRLRNHVIEEIKNYENRSRLAGIDPDVIYTGRYVLCSLIDETVLNTLWGSDSIWTSQSLLSTLHNETSGGETFFVILDRLLKDPNSDLDLLEMLFLCISLGFKGRYAVIERGHEKLEELRNSIYEQIRRRRGEFSLALSPHWQSESTQQTSLRNFVPLWVVGAVAGALLLVIFSGFTLVLNESVSPVHDALLNIGKPAALDATGND